MSFKSILLGTSAHKSYTHDMSFDNNTTMDFGVLQPLLSQYMEPNSKIKVNTRQLVRLAPMPTPSFARMFLQNYARFVLMTDVVPYWESLLSGIPFNGITKTFTPTEMPYTDNKVLQMHLCLRSDIAVYSRPNRDSEYSLMNLSQSSVYDAVFLAFIKYFGVSSASDLQEAASYLDPFGAMRFTDDIVTPESSDYIVHTKPSLSSSTEYLYCIRYSNRAKRIRKQLVGLGYSLSACDTSHLSVAPLLAYYKAYFNYFGLTRDIQFETTNCFKLIMEIWDYGIDFSSNMFSSTANIDSLFFNFLDDLGDLYYTDSNSYVASHRVKITNNASLPAVSPGYLANSNGTNITQQTNGLPQQSGTHFNQLTLDVLKRLSTYVAKDSVIGRRMSDWVKVHYGADVSFSLFKDSFNVSEWRTPIDIDDIFSTSETADVGNKYKGDYLGAYAGKGVGFGKEFFSFEAPKHGFLFVMSCIVPQANIFQGNDPTLYAVDNDTIPHPEFDALGYELTPALVILPDNFVSDGLDTKDYSTEGFGFVPRYTGFKTKKNIVNGDMCCGYFKRDLLPYFNDRYIVNNRMNVVPNKTDSKKFQLIIANNLAPRASTSWQQICRYGSLSNFNRLFYNSGEFAPTLDNSAVFTDNFICQTVFDVKLTNWMKPIQNSYDTVGDGDNSTINLDTN